MDVIDIVIRDQGGEANIDLGTVADREIEVRFPAAAQIGDGSLEQFHVHGKPDLVYLPTLIGPQ